MKELNIVKLCLLRASQLGKTLFRQNVGTGWVGKVIKLRHGQQFVAEHGDVLVRKARPLRAGLCEGSSDLIGWESITITQEMVGRKVAVFTAIEVKTPRGRLSKGQSNFLHQVKKAGGKAAMVRDPSELETI